MTKILKFENTFEGIKITVETGNGKRASINAETHEEALKAVLDQVASFDSAESTLVHIRTVQAYLNKFVAELLRRGEAHDASKLGPVEKPHFDRETQALKGLTYGTEEYKASLGRLREALEHHYKANSHHPEHHAHGVADMNLFDIVEMFADWKAASERQAGGAMDLEASFERFKFDPQLANIFRQTARAMGITTKRDIEEQGKR